MTTRCSRTLWTRHHRWRLKLHVTAGIMVRLDLRPGLVYDLVDECDRCHEERPRNQRAVGHLGQVKLLHDDGSLGEMIVDLRPKLIETQKEWARAIERRDLHGR